MVAVKCDVILMQREIACRYRTNQFRLQPHSTELSYGELVSEAGQDNGNVNFCKKNQESFTLS